MNIKSFENIVLLILLYGVDIWEYQYCESIQTVYTHFYKRILSAGLSWEK